MFDKEYQKLWRPLDINISFGSISNAYNRFDDPHEICAVTVQWSDAPIASFINNYKCGKPMRIEYTVEMVPNTTAENPLKSHLYYKDNSRLDKVENEEKPLLERQYDYSETFYCPYLGLCSIERPKSPAPNDDKEDKGDKKAPPEIKILISTEINGRTIAQKTERVPLLPLKRSLPE